ncbi:hypothetical protein [Cryptosporangium sp. NPDC051539]|uniref:hypothetical protein n=1 Tax=Cryptosporangium sp. NPDC051539 TaxID=3363962 RepID=UPI00379D1701
MTNPEHPEFGSELGLRTGQAFAVLATLTEASARLAAEEARRAERAEHITAANDDLTKRLLAQQQRLAGQAELAHESHDREFLREASDQAWIADASLDDLAHAWRIGRSREGQPAFATAGLVAEAVEDRLRHVYGDPMDFYDRMVASGVRRSSAMKLAAEQMAIMARDPVEGRADHVPTQNANADRFQHDVWATQDAIRDSMQPDVVSPYYDQLLHELSGLSPTAVEAIRRIRSANPNLRPVQPEAGPDRAASEIASDFYPGGPASPPSSRPAASEHHRTQLNRLDQTRRRAR